VSGGAIDNSADDTITISDSQFMSNSAIATAAGEFAYAGAVDNGQTMAITNCVFIGNRSVAGIGGNANAGAVDNGQTMTISNSLFTGNSAVGGPMADGVNTFGRGIGGAIETGGGPTIILTLFNSIVAGNQAIGGSGGSTLANSRTNGAFGGGIFNGNGEGTLNVNGCTITGNQVVGGASGHGTGGPAVGGGIDNNLINTLNLTNSTISSNLCQGGQGASGYAGGVAAGGGIGNDRTSIAIITNCTLSMNQCLAVRAVRGPMAARRWAPAPRTGFTPSALG
jgi:hypothetical protein